MRRDSGLYSFEIDAPPQSDGAVRPYCSQENVGYGMPMNYGSFNFPGLVIDAELRDAIPVGIRRNLDGPLVLYRLSD